MLDSNPKTRIKLTEIQTILLQVEIKSQAHESKPEAITKLEDENKKLMIQNLHLQDQIEKVHESSSSEEFKSDTEIQSRYEVLKFKVLELEKQIVKKEHDHNPFNKKKSDSIRNRFNPERKGSQMEVSHDDT